MLTALIFYTLLFNGLVILPAALILVVLLSFERKRRFWRRLTPIVEFIGAILGRWPVIRVVSTIDSREL